MKTIIVLVLLALLTVWIPHQVVAEYVLPYPSYMPGNKVYKVSRIIDQVKKFWYWGSIGRVKYHLGLADKYLVEAKTLFEYKQYLLAVDALKRSDGEFKKIPAVVQQAKREGKDTRLLEDTIRQAGGVHQQVLEKLQQELPAEFTWTPEKKEPTVLHMSRFLEESVQLRR